ncbi:hypothetical protein [Dongia sp.]|uniref:hypothetical protein n=1 Tax=Dongia sp. TaxID=1977262 RepID=UPI0035AF32E7
MIARGLLISALLGATLLAGCAWEGGASQPVQPGSQTQGGIAPKPAPAHGVMPDAKRAPVVSATPAAPAPSAAPEALMNPAQPADVIGSWQMVQLPPNFLQPTRPTAPFSNPWQWFIFSPVDATGVGRIGIVSRVEPPKGVVTDKALADAWAQSPMFDTYRMGGGTVSVTPVAITGWSAQGTQTWRTYMVTNAGLMLGMQAIPGDMLMILTGEQNQPLYYRMLRRVPRVQP